jgi:hypothetical protein
MAPVASVLASSNRHVAPGQPVTHDAGTDDGGQQEGSTESLSYSTSGHSTPLRPASRHE